METVSVTVLDYEEFDRLVNEHTPTLKWYECLADNEWNNDSDHYFVDVAPEALDRYDRDILGKVFASVPQPHYASRLLLTELVKLGVLLPGNYLIRVCW